MDKGRVGEFGEPHALLGDPSSMLSMLVQETGPIASVALRASAAEASRRRSAAHAARAAVEA
jgi:hypothetical protein